MFGPRLYATHVGQYTERRKQCGAEYDRYIWNGVTAVLTTFLPRRIEEI